MNSVSQPQQDEGPSSAPTPATGVEPALSHSPRWISLGERYGLLIVLAAVIAFFSLSSDVFLTSRNFETITRFQSVNVVVALSLLLPLIAGKFDLSVGSVTLLSSIVAAQVMANHGFNLLTASVIVVAMGLTIGAVNGILVTRFGLDALIATLGTATILGALTQWHSKGRSTLVTSRELRNFGTASLFGVPWLAIVALLLSLVFGFVITQTPVGRMLASIGSSPEAARLVGVRVDRLVTGSFIASGGTAALAGLLVLAQQGSASPGAQGLSILLPALAGVFLGASTWQPGQFNVIGTLLGLMLLGVLVSGLTLRGTQPWVSPLSYGCALLLAVSTSAWFRRKRRGTP